MATEQQLAAAKADKYIGRDGSDPRPVGRHNDAELLAYIVARFGVIALRHEGMAALSRTTGLPSHTLQRMAASIDFHEAPPRTVQEAMDDIPF